MNIKTINSQSILGSGNIEIGSGGTFIQEQADWNQTDQTAVDFIKNKPEIPDAEVFVVTFTETIVEQEEGGEIIFNTEIIADKTISQIVTAQNNGLLVIGQFIPAQVGAEGHQTYLLNYCNLYAQEGEVAEFYRIYQNSIHYINYVKQTTPTQEGGEVVNIIINVRNTPLAALNSPNFTGTPTAPTAPVGTNTTQLATTAFVKQAIDNIPTSGDENVIEGITLNGTSLQPDANKVVAITGVATQTALTALMERVTTLESKVTALEAAQVNYTFNRTDNSLEINSGSNGNG